MLPARLKIPVTRAYAETAVMRINGMARWALVQVLATWFSIRDSDQTPSVLASIGWTHQEWEALVDFAGRVGVNTGLSTGYRRGEPDINGDLLPPPPPGSPAPLRDRPTHTPGYRNPLERDDIEERAAGNRVGGSAYRPHLGPPPRCSPGDTRMAHAYLVRIEELLALEPDEDGARWTRKERTRLKMLRGKWRRRAEGKDARFNLVGNRPGGLTPDLQAQVALAQSLDNLLDATHLETKRGKTQRRRG